MNAMSSELCPHRNIEERSLERVARDTLDQIRALPIALKTLLEEKKSIKTRTRTRTRTNTNTKEWPLSCNACRQDALDLLALESTTKGGLWNKKNVTLCVQNAGLAVAVLELQQLAHCPGTRKTCQAQSAKKISRFFLQSLACLLARSLTHPIACLFVCSWGERLTD